MNKTILITGATSGIGHETATALAAQGHHLLVHGRSAKKVEALERSLQGAAAAVEGFVADLSRLDEVKALADAVQSQHDTLDVLINNAGVLKTPQPVTDAGQDVRFLVNTLAPWVLAQRLLPLLSGEGRVINLSSAAQNPVDLDALAGRTSRRLSDFDAYAQSKLALTMWSCQMGRARTPEGPAVVAVNPGSMLGTNMVKEGFGVDGKDVRIGADILVRAALSEEFGDQSGAYFDNDAGRFASPHPDALEPAKCEAVIELLNELRG